MTLVTACGLGSKISNQATFLCHPNTPPSPFPLSFDLPNNILYVLTQSERGKPQSGKHTLRAWVLVLTHRNEKRISSSFHLLSHSCCAEALLEVGIVGNKTEWYNLFGYQSRSLKRRWSQNFKKCFTCCLSPVVLTWTTVQRNSSCQQWERSSKASVSNHWKV